MTAEHDLRRFRRASFVGKEDAFVKLDGRRIAAEPPGFAIGQHEIDAGAIRRHLRPNGRVQMEANGEGAAAHPPLDPLEAPSCVPAVDGEAVWRDFDPRA